MWREGGEGSVGWGETGKTMWREGGEGKGVKAVLERDR